MVTDFNGQMVLTMLVVEVELGKELVQDLLQVEQEVEVLVDLLIVVFLLRRLLEGSREPDGKQNAAAEITQKIDGSSLPEFDQVSRYFGSSGLSMQSTPDGWYFVGVGLWDGGQQPAGTQDAK